MVKSLKLRNFTAFSELDLEFAPGLNVFVGENGTGKSHLLKVLYSVIDATTNPAPPEAKTEEAIGLWPVHLKDNLQKRLASVLLQVFRPEALGRLVRRRRGRQRCELGVDFADASLSTAFRFATNSRSEVTVDSLPSEVNTTVPVFLPTRELLSIYPGFVSLYEGRYVEFEKTWRDTCVLLGEPALRGAREQRIANLVAPLEEAMGGTVELDANGRFYLNMAGQGRLEIPLVAEGLRKLAMLARLIATGSLLDKGYLFWDEPDANLNPKLVKGVAEATLGLCDAGIQVWIATHSLFLMRELDVLLQGAKYRSVPARFFGLHVREGEVEVMQSDSIDEIGPIVALDESLKQSDRYMEVS